MPQPVLLEDFAPQFKIGYDPNQRVETCTSVTHKGWMFRPWSWMIRRQRWYPMILLDMRCPTVPHVSHVFASCDPCGETEEGCQGISFYNGSGQTLHGTCGFPTAGRLLAGSMACYATRWTWMMHWINWIHTWQIAIQVWYKIIAIEHQMLSSICRQATALHK